MTHASHEPTHRPPPPHCREGGGVCAQKQWEEWRLLGVVAYAYNPRVRKSRGNSYKFKASLSCKKIVSNEPTQRYVDGILTFGVNNLPDPQS